MLKAQLEAGVPLIAGSDIPACHIRISAAGPSRGKGALAKMEANQTGPRQGSEDPECSGLYCCSNSLEGVSDFYQRVAWEHTLNMQKEPLAKGVVLSSGQLLVSGAGKQLGFTTDLHVNHSASHQCSTGWTLVFFFLCTIGVFSSPWLQTHKEKALYHAGSSVQITGTLRFSMHRPLIQDPLESGSASL